MQRPVIFIARSWHGRGGMQRLNRDVCHHVGGGRLSFPCIHPATTSAWSFFLFCIRSVVTAAHWRGRGARIHVGDVAALPLGVLCAWCAGAKLSVTACGLDVIYPRWFYQFLIRRCLRRVDHVIAISEATAQEVMKRGVSSDRIIIIPCGIDPSPALAVGDRNPHLLVTVGRLVQRKGVVWFLEHVFPRLLQQYPNLHYCIIGDGSERIRIHAGMKKLHLQNNVTLMTDASDKDSAAIMSSAGLFIAPNIMVKGDMEGFGIVCLEAADAGLPVIASDSEGLRDAVIDGATGMFFRAGDADDCVHVIEKMLANPFTSESVHAAVADRFAWEKLAPLYNNVFDS